MSHCNGSRRAALAVTLLAVGVLAACGGGATDTRPAQAELTVMLPQALASTDVVRVSVEVSGPGISPPILVDLTQSGTTWQSTITNIPAGTGRLFVATAFDSAATPLFKGQAGPLNIESGRTASVAIVLQQLEVPPPFENEAPSIDSLVASANPVEPGGTVTLTATAHDPNGDPLRYTWTATAGTFGAPGSAVTTWTAPATEGTQRLQLEVVDSKGTSATLSIDIAVLLPGSVGSAAVTASFNTWPIISSMNGVPSVLVLGSGTLLSASVTDTDGDAPRFMWSSDCEGRFDNPTLPTPTFTLVAPPATGRCAFKLLVSDGRGGQHTGALILRTGAGKPPDGAPQIDGSWQSPLEASGGELVTMGVSAHDPEGLPLRYSWSTSVGDFMWAPRDSATSTERTLRLPACFGGPVLVTASILDAAGNSMKQLFSIAALPGSECSPTLVTGVRGALKVQPDGSVIPSPYGLSGTAIGAWVPEGSGYSWRAGTGHDYGTFAIPGVPEGSPYLLRYGRDYIWTDKRGLDLNQVVLGRPLAVLEPDGAQLEVQLDGLSPWGAQDDLQFHSATAGLGYISTYGCVTGFPLPAEGGTSISGSYDYATFTQSCGTSPYWLDPSQDTLYVAQLASRTEPVTGIDYQETRRSLRFSGPARTSTGSILLKGTMEALPTSSQPLNIRAPEFESLALAVHPTATLTENIVGIDTLLGYTQYGPYSGSPDLAIAYDHTPGGGDFNPVFEFSNPYPREWPLYVYTQVGSAVRYSIALPDGSTSSSRSYASYVMAMEPLVPGTTPSIVPKVGPARDVRINGLDATGKLMGVGTTPVVSWAPPALGVPTYYQLRLYRLYTAPGSTSLARQLLTYLYTPQTQLRLPPDLLVPGENYYLQVVSYYRPGTDSSNPFRYSATTHYAQAFTGVFKP